MAKQHSRGSVSAGLDRIASVVQESFRALNIPQKVAMDFAYRCDLLADYVDGRGITAGVNETGESVEPGEVGFDADTIGDEVAGPLSEIAPEETWMDGHFTQERFQRLNKFVHDGDQFVANPKVASELRKLQATVNSLQKRIAALTAGEDEDESEETASKKASARRADEALLRRLIAEEEAAAEESDSEAGEDEDAEEVAKQARRALRAKLSRRARRAGEDEEAEDEDESEETASKKASVLLRRLLAEEGMDDESDAEAGEDESEDEDAEEVAKQARRALRARLSRRAGEDDSEDEDAEEVAKQARRALRARLSRRAHRSRRAGEDSGSSEAEDEGEPVSKKSAATLRRLLAEEGMDAESDAEANRPWGSTKCSPGTPTSTKADRKKYHEEYGPCYNEDFRRKSAGRLDGYDLFSRGRS